MLGSPIWGNCGEGAGLPQSQFRPATNPPRGHRFRLFLRARGASLGVGAGRVFRVLFVGGKIDRRFASVAGRFDGH